MTTLVGIVSKKDEPAVVLGADRAETWQHEESKFMCPMRKILVDDDRKYAFAMTGVRDGLYEDFALDIIRGKIDLQKKLERGYLPELHKMNSQRVDYVNFEEKHENNLIVASRVKEPSLYQVWPLGRVIKIPLWKVRGPEEVKMYLETHDFRLFELEVEEVVKRVLDALEIANQNTIMRGYDLAVISKSGIDYYGDFMQNAFDKAKAEIFEKVLRQVRNKKKGK